MSQSRVSAAAGAGAAVADWERNVAPAGHDPTAGKIGNTARFPAAAAVFAKCALASSNAQEVRHPKKAPPKSTDTTQTAAGSSGNTPAASGPTAQATPPTVSAGGGSGSPIGQLTTGDSALGERTKHETADLIGGTQQGLNAIKRSLSTEEQVTATQIRTFLKQAQQELDSGDADGAHTLATKAKLLLDELTKP